MTTTVDVELWSAIGGPTRRRLLHRLLADGVGTATTLSDQLPVTRQAVAKHLAVLDRVSLVHVTPAGRSGTTESTTLSSLAPSRSCQRSEPTGMAPRAHQADRRVDQRNNKT